MDITWLDPSNPEDPFPEINKALENPEGLLAAGGDLSEIRLLRAYRSGIFPWYEDGQPILWWSPNPRGVLFTEKFNISSSLRRTIRKHNWKVTFDGNFRKTVLACASPRSYARGTWITSEMVEAYCHLHEHGHAHSVELWNAKDQIVGGIYGVLIGTMFYGESMFSFETNASKVALAYLSMHLNYWGFPLLDCQLPSKHLTSLGAETMQRTEYLEIMTPLSMQSPQNFNWEFNNKLNLVNWNK